MRGLEGVLYANNSQGAFNTLEFLKTVTADRRSRRQMIAITGLSDDSNYEVARIP